MKGIGLLRTYNIIVAATQGSACDYWFSRGSDIHSWHYLTASDRTAEVVRRAQDYDLTIITLISPDRKGSTRTIPSELLAIPNVEVRYMGWCAAAHKYLELARGLEQPTIRRKETMHFADGTKVTVEHSTQAGGPKAVDWGEEIHRMMLDNQIYEYFRIPDVARGIHHEEIKGAPMRIKVTADTPVRLVTTELGEYRLLVDTVVLDIEVPYGFPKWFHDTYGNVPVSFADVWDACPNFEWLRTLSEAVGLRPYTA